MGPKDLTVAFSAQQLAVFLLLAVLALLLLMRYAVNQFRTSVEAGFKAVNDRLDELQAKHDDLPKTYPTRTEVREMIGRRVAEAQLGAHPWRRSTDETLPGSLDDR